MDGPRTCAGAGAPDGAAVASPLESDGLDKGLLAVVDSRRSAGASRQPGGELIAAALHRQGAQWYHGAMLADVADLETHRATLTGHCYRMLGSAVDADDAVPEAMVRASRSLDRFDGRSSLRTGCTALGDHRPRALR